MTQQPRALRGQTLREAVETLLEPSGLGIRCQTGQQVRHQRLDPAGHGERGGGALQAVAVALLAVLGRRCAEGVEQVRRHVRRVAKGRAGSGEERSRIGMEVDHHRHGQE